MIKNQLLAAAVLFSATAFAQNVPTTGATIKTSSGMLTGFVRNPSDPSTPQSFSFATDKGGPFRQLTVADIERAELADGSVYERHYIEVPVIAVPELDRGKSSYNPTVYFKGAALVQKMVTGKLSLYTFDDRYEMPHFFFTENSDTALTLLPYEPYVNERTSTIEGGNDFRNPLNRLAITMGCDKGTVASIGSVAYSEHALIPLFRRLNACDGSAAQVNGPSAGGVRARFGIHAGVGFQSRSSGEGTYIDPRFKMTGTAPTFGLFTDLYLGRRNESNILSIALFYRAVSRTYKYTMPVSAGYYGVSAFEDKYTLGEGGLDITARHLFGSGAIRPFVEGGFAGYSIFSPKVTRKNTDINGNTADGGSLEYEGGGITFDAQAGAGIQHNRGSLHLRYGRSMDRQSIGTISISARVRFR